MPKFNVEMHRDEKEILTEAYEIIRQIGGRARDMNMDGLYNVNTGEVIEEYVFTTACRALLFLTEGTAFEFFEL